MSLNKSDHRFEVSGKGKYRTKFIEMISTKFLPLYETKTKAILLDAFAKFGVRAHPFLSSAVINIIKVSKKKWEG